MGRRDRTFYSGPGSDDAQAEPYCAAVKAFLVESGARSIVDLGCGDSRVPARLLGPEGSGVCLGLPPFNRVISQVLCEVTLPHRQGTLQTVLLEQSP